MNDQREAADQVVAAWRAPAWVRRIPPLGWLFLALAAADVLIRASATLPSILPRDVGQYAGTVIGLVHAGVAVALPAAVLIGPASGPARRALLYGTGAIAAGELLGLAVERLPFPDVDLFARPAFPEDALRLIVALLGFLGPAVIALGLRWAGRDGAAWQSTGVRVTLAVAVVAALAQLGTTAYGLLAMSYELLWPIAPIDLIGVALSATITLAWGLAAAGALAVRRGGLGGTWLVAGTMAIFGARAVRAGFDVASIPLSSSPNDAITTLYFWGINVIVAATVLGFVLLFAALTVAPDGPPEARLDHPAS